MAGLKQWWYHSPAGDAPTIEGTKATWTTSNGQPVELDILTPSDVTLYAYDESTASPWKDAAYGRVATRSRSFLRQTESQTRACRY